MRTRLWIAVWLFWAPLMAQRLRDLRTPVPVPPGSVLVIGFLGGFEHWNDAHRGVRKLVVKLRAERGVFAESIENHHRKVALTLIRRAVDTNRDGKLDAQERRNARIILFGQSWGGSAAVNTARELNKLGVPVMLTVQVDSVGLHDGLIPPNVASAVNFYQHDPLTIQGRREIRAEDPSRTTILGNFEASYLFHGADSPDGSWARRKLGGGHAKMEMDPEIWSRVEDYILEALQKR